MPKIQIDHNASLEFKRSFLDALGRFSRLVASLPRDPIDAMRAQQTADRIHRLVVLLLETPFDGIEDSPLFRAATQSISQLQWMLDQLDIQCLANDFSGEPFSDIEFGRRIRGLKDEELISLLPSLIANPATLGKVEQLNRLVWFSPPPDEPPSYVPLIKAAVVVILETLKRALSKTEWEDLLKKISDLWDEVDKLIGKQPPDGGKTPGKKPGPGTQPTPGASTTGEPCCVTITLEKVTADRVDPLVGNHWHLSFFIDGREVKATENKDGFTGSPLALSIPGAPILLDEIEKGECHGVVSVTIDVEATARIEALIGTDPGPSAKSGKTFTRICPHDGPVHVKVPVVVRPIGLAEPGVTVTCELAIEWICCK